MFHTNFHIKCVNYNVGHARELDQGIHFVKSPLAMQEGPEITLPKKEEKGIDWKLKGTAKSTQVQRQILYKSWLQELFLLTFISVLFSL